MSERKLLGKEELPDLQKKLERLSNVFYRRLLET